RVIRAGVEREDNMDLRPSTDDWPFFFLNIPWTRLLPALRGQPSPLTNPIAFLLVSLVGLVVLAVTLIGWPLWRLRRRGPSGERPGSSARRDRLDHRHALLLRLAAPPGAPARPPLDAAPRPPRDRGGPGRSRGLRDGHAVSDRARPRGGACDAVRCLGLGRQW